MQILRLFFTLPPLLVSIPVGQIVSLALFMLIVATLALSTALVAIYRVQLASILKES